MKLYRVGVTHFSPKDSHEAIEAWLLARDDEAVISWLADRAYWPDEDKDEDEEGADESFEPSSDWWDKHPDEAARAESMGLEITLCDWGDRNGRPESVSGPWPAMLRWWRGDFREVSDLYYGATRYDWSEGVEIGDDEAAMLLRLGVVEAA